MKSSKFDISVKILIEESQYYDKEKIELKNILKEVNPSQTIIDIGAGVGRLSLPIAKQGKFIVALDSNKKLKDYYIVSKNKNLKFICDSAKNYLKNKQFDIFILAWPPLDKRLIKNIKRSMHKDSKLLVLIPDNYSDYESIVEKIGVVSELDFKKFEINKQNFFHFLKKEFQHTRIKLLKTNYSYKNDADAFDKIKQNIEFWYGIKLTKQQSILLRQNIADHQNNRFKELVHFYVLSK